KYFLTCYDIVKFARKQNILCQGRGAAANSAVCYCLGITAVNPTKIDLLLSRFISKERNEPPDIDIDFEHKRREEVIQYIYKKYSREKAALTAEIITYRLKSAKRDLAKALGSLSLSLNREKYNDLFQYLLKEMQGFPRHFSQHVGGFIISQTPLYNIVPIQNASMPSRTIIEWDKDDIEELGILKIDILALGILTCLKKALKYINKKRIKEKLSPIELYSVPQDDKKVFNSIAKGDTIGVFQLESRAQIAMLPRVKPKCFYDLVIEIALVRPGPLQGNMVHPYLRRRNNLETPSYPDKIVKKILGKTLGIPIFQEQAMKLAIYLADFTPGEAEMLRRAMSAWKKNKTAIEKLQEEILNRMIKKGYSKDFAKSCVNQLKGFSEYGFPESHAASFALLAYASAYLRYYYPAEYAAAILNSQPMGFYPPAQIINDAQTHGVKVLPIDINKSKWFTFALKNSKAIQLGLHLVKYLSIKQYLILKKIKEKTGDFTSIEKIWEEAA
ncbi:MAG: error-prone DNA polymerase, partial [Candidatus Dadabacteria bacterium]